LRSARANSKESLGSRIKGINKKNPYFQLNCTQDAVRRAQLEFEPSEEEAEIPIPLECVPDPERKTEIHFRTADKPEILGIDWLKPQIIKQTGINEPNLCKEIKLFVSNSQGAFDLDASLPDEVPIKVVSAESEIASKASIL
jgi:hypothetical protein